MITPGASFKDNLQLLPPIDGIARIDLIQADGSVMASIENQPGKQGSLTVYQYLHQTFGTIDTRAAEHGIAVFAEHTADAKQRPGAHPNIDLLFDVINRGIALTAKIIPA
ncbi:MAG: DUF2322 family protein [Sulfitobacter sp.]